MDAMCDRAVGNSAVADIPMLTENALRVLQSRYLMRNQEGLKEAPADLFRRVARRVAEAEKDEEEQAKWADRFYQLMVSGRFMPNSPTLMNAGRRLGLLSACFVLPVPDDTAGIFQSIADTAIIQRGGGGTGFAFDELRPCGAFIASSGGKSSGPIAFWRVFSEATSAIQQGSFRRGANMAVMSVEHPDIIKFLHAKQDLQQFVNYNISVKVSDHFMKQVREHPDSPLVVRWKDDAWMLPRSIVDLCRIKIEAGCNGTGHPRELDICYGIQDLVPLGSVDVEDDSDVLSVGEVMGLIVEYAWRNGEPGLFFIDRVRDTEVFPVSAPIHATNPCGEEPLPANASCNLGSINLGRFVTPFDEAYKVDFSELSSSHVGLVSRGEAEALVDWEKLRETVVHAVRFLDNVVSVNKYPTEAIQRQAENDRRIGLGVMGFADALLRLGVRYDSDEGMYWGERFMKFVNGGAIQASQRLAEDRGPFPWFKKDNRWKKPIRNACVTTVAPTGTISIIADCSGGMEPWFSFAFVRQVLDDGKGGRQRMVQYQSDFRRMAERFGFGSDELTEHILSTGTLQDRDEVPLIIKHVFRSALDIAPEWHVKMQAVFQRQTTSAVSKTINLLSGATVDDVRTAYMLAHASGCKGVTVYRDGSREEQPMALTRRTKGRMSATQEQEFLVLPDAPSFRQPISISSAMPSVRWKYRSTYGNLHMHVSLEPLEDGRYREREVFFNLGRSGDGIHEIIDCYGRLCSMLMRLDAPIDVLVDQLHGHASRGEKANGRTGALTSLPNELAMGLMEYHKIVEDLRDEGGFLRGLPSFFNRQATKKIGSPPSGNGGTTRSQAFMDRVRRNVANAGTLRQPCPTRDCPGQLVYTEGCRKCLVCGQGSC